MHAREAGNRMHKQQAMSTRHGHCGVRTLPSARRLVTALLFLLLASPAAVVTAATASQPPAGRADIEEQLGRQIPAELIFTGTDGIPVQLGTLLQRPTVLVLVYFCCTTQCSTVMDNLVTALRELPQHPGKDYNVVIISFDDAETPAVARRKQDSVRQVAGPAFPPGALRFLVGDRTNIAALLAATGFHAIAQDGEFIHSTALIITAPGGKIARYVHGSQYLAAEISQALTETAAGKTGGSIGKMLSLCFTGDPAARRQALAMLRWAGVGVTVALLILLAFLLRPRRQAQAGGGVCPPSAPS